MRTPGRPCYWVDVRLRVALTALLLAVACSRGGPASVHVVSVRATGLGGEALREAGLDEATLEAAARDALAAAGFAAGEGKRPHRAEISVDGVRLAPPGAAGGAPRVEVSIELSLAPAEPGAGGATREAGTGSAPLTGGNPRRDWRTAAERAARQAAEGLALAYAEDAKSLDKLIADLSSEDPRVRDHAVRVLADRRSPAAVPALLERLKDEDRRVVHRAVGALAQIGDERAVPALIDLSRSGDPALAARVARIIGDIGGAEAEGYLLTLEAGHPDPRVRSAAREALADLEARAADRKGSVAARK
ncbi:MAG TPA: HEAT repeat domain-containing protein [Anaeromyxobacter sp.]|nr:HEAT repeat domain-containing protein [Anaeromyxobacter sp.]